MICQGCLQEKNISSSQYCAACRRSLFDNRDVSNLLSFNKQEYIDFRVSSGGRFSISGLQPKILLKLEGKELTPAIKGGKYILKSAPLSYNIPRFTEDVPANEHLTMQIARQIFKINAAKNCFIRLKSNEPAYLTKRFDRQKDGTGVPQEDFCQLMNISKETHGDDYKYQFSYESIANIIKRYCVASIVELEKFFKLLLFNYVLSNGDAHLKNFSLQQSSHGDYLIAPAYDLLCTALHFPNETRTALDLFDDHETKHYLDNGFYTGACFIQFGKKIRIRDTFVNKEIARYFEKESDVKKMVECSQLSSEAKKEYMERYKDRLIAISIGRQ